MDGQIVLWLNRAAGFGHWLDYLAWFLAEWAIGLQALLILIQWFFPGARPVRERQRLLLAMAGAVFALGLSQVTELFYYRERPFVALPEVFDLLGGRPSDAFPSQHGVVALGLALGVGWRRPLVGGGWRLPVFAVLHWALALGTVWSRVYAGVHYPTDMVGSLFYAGLVTWVYARLRRELEPATTRILAWLRALPAGVERRPGES